VIPPETRAEIRRLFFADHFAVNTIVETLGVHHDTVEGAIGVHNFASTPVLRKSQLDPFIPFIFETLEKYPKLRATRLFLMLRDRGYVGSVQQLRRVVKRLRRAPATAYLTLTTLPGEQAQCDWGSFGTLRVGRATRKLSCFVMVLSHSRLVYARFTFDQTMATFLACHVEAFRSFGGVPRVILYDNLKTAVLERIGQAIRFHPELLELAGHCHFRPQPCNVAAGWEKGRVERAIGHIRTSYAEARHYRDIDDANRQLRQWVDEVANVRPWPQDRSRKVDDVWRSEKPKLLPLPEHDIETAHVQPIRSGKTPYVRFDLNDYTIPHTLVRKPLTLRADEDAICILDGVDEVARHRRSYDRGQRIEERRHLDGLVAERRRALPGKTQDRLRAMAPEVDRLFETLALRGENLGFNVARLASLLTIYGIDDFRAAVAEAIACETPRATSVGNILERRVRARKAPVVLPVQLPDNPRVRDLRVISHDPASYDSLGKPHREDDHDRG
jgi:transposase